MTGRHASAALAALSLAACASEAHAPEVEVGAPPAPYLAFSDDFRDYTRWDSRRIDGAAEGSHPAGPRTIYVKAPRGKGGAYPVGAIIVKEMNTADGKTFAMVKRGAGFNATGARDWEWFEIVKGETGAPAIKWRGVGPPAGESYGGDAAGGCNACHAGAAAHDYVMSRELW